MHYCRTPGRVGSAHARSKCCGVGSVRPAGGSGSPHFAADFHVAARSPACRPACPPTCLPAHPHVQRLAYLACPMCLLTPRLMLRQSHHPCPPPPPLQDSDYELCFSAYGCGNQTMFANSPHCDPFTLEVTAWALRVLEPCLVPNHYCTHACALPSLCLPACQPACMLARPACRSPACMHLCDCLLSPFPGPHLTTNLAL